jgi:predicted site-specific integrase-resolvase
MDQEIASQEVMLLTEAELAKNLQVKIFTLRKWRREGGGPLFVRCGGRLIRYFRRDVERWLSSNRYANSAQELSRSHQSN